MNTREKFRYMAFGGALVFLGMLGAMMSPLTAEKDKFGEIECTRLKVVDADGKELVVLGANLRGGQVDVNSSKFMPGGLNIEARGVRLGVDDHGGTIEGHGEQLLSPKLTLDIDSRDGSGHIAVYGKNTPAIGQVTSLLVYPGATMVVLDVDEHGGRVDAVGKSGAATLAITKHDGGVASVGNKNGQSCAVLGIDEHGGHVAAFGKDGKSGASLSVTEDGGYVEVRGKGEGLAVMSINEYGNGAVSTWDKNGYRQ